MPRRPRIVVRSVFAAALLGAGARAQDDSMLVGSVWSGAVTSSSATVVARFDRAGRSVRLRASEDEALTAPSFSNRSTTLAVSGNAVRLTLQGLKPDTLYHYGVEVDGVLRTDIASRGRFRTFPSGRASFKIAFAGDSDFRAPDQRAFAAIAAEQPLLFIHLGDLHYSDTDSSDIGDYRVNYDGVLNEPSQAALFRSVPTAYIWGDHDFCGDNSNGSSVGRDVARAAYLERVPHYPLGKAGSTLAQAFTIGRVRVIMTDNRSASAPASQRESASKSRLGSAQKAWFKQELLLARDAGYPLILWVNPDPWIAAASVGEDTWGGYATERTEIANFIRDNRISNVVILSADMHALAYDDGTHADYATGGGAPMQVLHAASLTAEPNAKGGPYTVGPLLGNLQYGILEIYDSGGRGVACRFRGMNVGLAEPRITQIFSSAVGRDGEHALSNISTLARIVRPDDTVVSGFVIEGASRRRILVRAAGPTLSVFGVPDPLMRPVLSVHKNGTFLARNAGWASDVVEPRELAGLFDRVGAFRFLDETSRDAALELSLEPGAYTVEVRSEDGRSGAVLLEVYRAP